MGTITLKNVRTTSDVTMNTSLKDGGVYIDWSELADIKAWLWSDAQKALAGRCDVRVDTDDPTNLICEYASTKAQYPGINRLVVQATYMGETKTYDKPAFNFVRWTAGQTGEQVTIDDPDVDVAIEVTDVSSSILQRAISAALAAAAHAEHAASLVPLQVLQDCEAATAVALTAASKAPVIGENGHWWVWNSEQEAYVDTGKQAKGDTGNGIASFSVVESEEDDADNVVTVTFTDGTTETFNVKNGKTGNGIASIVQTVESPDDAGTNVITVTMTNGTVITFNVKNGSKGQPGAAQAAYKSVETLPTASAETMDKIYLTPSGTAGVYNMSYTEFDGTDYTWASLGTTAIQLSDYAQKAAFDALADEVRGVTILDYTGSQAIRAIGDVAEDTPVLIEISGNYEDIDHIAFLKYEGGTYTTLKSTYYGNQGLLTDTIPAGSNRIGIYEKSGKTLSVHFVVSQIGTEQELTIAKSNLDARAREGDVGLHCVSAVDKLTNTLYAAYLAVKSAAYYDPNSQASPFVRMIGYFANLGAVQVTLTYDRTTFYDFKDLVSAAPTGVKTHLMRNGDKVLRIVIDWDKLTTNFSDNTCSTFFVENTQFKNVIWPISVDLQEQIDEIKAAIETDEVLGYDGSTTSQNVLNCVVCPVKKVSKIGMIKSVYIEAAGAGNFGIYVGTLDENYHFNVRESFTVEIDAAGTHTIDVSDQKVYARPGESIALQYVGGRFFAAEAGEPEDDLSFYYTKESQNNDPFQLQVFGNPSKRIKFGFKVTISEEDWQQLGKRVSDLEQRVDSIEGVLGFAEETVGYNGASNAQNIVNSVVCPVKRVSSDGMLKSVYLKSDVAGNATILVGDVDQLYLFVARSSHTIPVATGEQTIDVSALKIYVKANERVALQYPGQRFLKTASGTPEAEDSFYYTADRTTNPLQLQVLGSATSKIWFSFQYVVEQSVFVSMESKIQSNSDLIDDLLQDVGTLSAKQGLVKDRAGDTYKLLVVNNSVVAIPLVFSHMICIGNSYTTHPTTTDAEPDYANNLWWGHWAMAASAKATSWPELLQTALRQKRPGAKVTPVFGRRYETGAYALTSDGAFTYWDDNQWKSLKANLASFSDVDCVLFFLGDNYTSGNEWYSRYKAMVEQFITWFPNAAIICCSTRYNHNNQIEGISQVAAEVQAVYVSMTGMGGDYANKIGAYVLGDDNNLHQINNGAVGNHYGDYGEWAIMDRIVKAIGYENNAALYDISITNPEGVSLTVKNAKTLEGAIVSVFADISAGYSLTGISVTSGGNAVTVTDHGVTDYGRVFTFQMPAGNVSITAA